MKGGFYANKMSNENPTDILRKEHEKVLKIIDVLEKNLEEGNANQAKKSIALLEKEFNKHSLNKEEKVLFLEIEKFIPRDGGPTGMMVIEHKDLTESIENFKHISRILHERCIHLFLLFYLIIRDQDLLQDDLEQQWFFHPDALKKHGFLPALYFQNPIFLIS